MPRNRLTNQILTWSLLTLSVVAGSLAAEFLGSRNEEARDARRLSQSPIESPNKSPSRDDARATIATPSQSESSKHVAVGAE